MTHLFLIRHGETDWNVEGRWQGQADVPLNGRGRAQALQIASALANANISAIYSSDLVRALATAQALAQVTGLPVRQDPRLREIHQGKWQGMLVRDIQARFGAEFERRRANPLSVAPPGGETVLQVRGRVVAAIDDIIRAHPQARVAVVSHGFALAVAQMHYQDLPVEEIWDLIPPNDEWRELVVDPAQIGSGA